MPTKPRTGGLNSLYESSDADNRTRRETVNNDVSGNETMALFGPRVPDWHRYFLDYLPVAGLGACPGEVVALRQ